MLYNSCYHLTQYLFIFLYCCFTKHNKHFTSGLVITEPIISKVGWIYFSVVQFHLVHSSVLVPTWWWADSSRGLLGADGFPPPQRHISSCRVSINIIYCNLQHIVLSIMFGFVPRFVQLYLGCLKCQQDISIGDLILSAFSPIVSPLNVEIVYSKVLIQVVLFICSFKNSLFSVIQVSYFVISLGSVKTMNIYFACDTNTLSYLKLFPTLC